MELRGFDSYPITLGDEMRGERASLGKSLGDAERDLRIKARMIVAIENCDLDGFPNRSVVAGYVRSYARYLGMDPDDCYQRFCAESGFESPTTILNRETGSVRVLPGSFGSEIAFSRFAAPPSRSRFQTRISLGAVTSAGALMALIAGLSYGGWALLQDIQRVGFAPLPEAPAVVAQAPLIAAPRVQAATAPLPDSSDYQLGGALAAVAAPAHLAPVIAMRRDGPISAIDPQTAGIFVPEPPTGQLAWIEPVADAFSRSALATPPVVAPMAADATAAVADAAAADAGTAAPGRALAGVALHAAEDAWIRIRERDGVIFEGILAAGEQYTLPPRVDSPMLKAGNAGALFILVDGVPYGPLGERGQIARNVSLIADDVRQSMPKAESMNAAAPPGDVHRRADAQAARN